MSNCCLIVFRFGPFTFATFTLGLHVLDLNSIVYSNPVYIIYSLLKVVYLSSFSPSQTVVPSLWIPNQSLNALPNKHVHLDCHVEAYPPASVTWLNSRDQPIQDSHRIQLQLKEKGYKTHLRLIIKGLSRSDFGLYKCVGSNNLGQQEAIVHLQGKPVKPIF